MKRIILALTMLALLVPAGASAYPDKTGICHRTAADSNPYVLIFPDHKSHDAHLGEADAGPAPQHPAKGGRQDYVASDREVAQGFCGDQPPPPPPPPPVFAPDASFIVCGDPRLLLTLDNGESTVPVTFNVTFTNASGARRYVTKWVDAGETDRLLRHVKGRSYLHVGAQRGLANEILIAGRLPRTTPWGTGVCASFDGLSSARAWANS